MNSGIKARVIARCFDSRRARVGIAISADICVGMLPAHPRAEGAAWSYPLDLPCDASGAWPELTVALCELRSAVPARHAVASVSLLPSLVRFRRLELPPLRSAELQRVLTRDAARYFSGVREPHVADARRVGLGSRGSVIAAAAPVRVIEAIVRSLTDSGWEIDSLVAAHSAWATAGAAIWPTLAAPGGWLVILGGSQAELLRIERGAVTMVRRVRGGSGLAARIADVLADIVRGGTPARVALIGAPGQSEELRDELRSRGVDVIGPPPRYAGIVTTPEMLAASFASRTAGSYLAPEWMHAERLQRVRRVTRSLGAAVAAALVATAGFELWGTHRELDAVLDRRAQIRTQVLAGMTARDTIVALEQRWTALSVHERDAPRWSTVIAHLAKHLPRDAHMTALRGNADSLSLDVVAGDAAGVFEAMRHTPGVRGVRSEAPIRRESTDGEAPIERFAVAAILAHAAAVPPVVETRP